MTDKDQAADEEVTRLFREAVENGRAYAGYWKTPFGKEVEEWHVARAVLDHLECHEGLLVTSLTTCEHDPPDCIAELADGRRVGIEVTELVDKRTVERHALRQHHEHRGGPPHRQAADLYETAQWTEEKLRSKLGEIVKKKDKRPRSGPFDQAIVAIFTDETMVTPELLERSTVNRSIDTEHFDSAYLVFSYDPNDTVGCAGGVRVVRLPVFRSCARDANAPSKAGCCSK